MLDINVLCLLDALALNTVRAKMMLAMFQNVDDEVLHEKFQELRADVSVLIRDTLSPLRLPKVGDPLKGELIPLGGDALKLAVAEILKLAFNLAVTMRCQRRIIYVNLQELELMDMIPFRSDTMTDIQQPEGRSRSDRYLHDCSIQLEADKLLVGIDRMNPLGKVEVIVQPALWRKGGEHGDFSAANVQIISKAKVIARKDFG